MAGFESLLADEPAGFTAKAKGAVKSGMQKAANMSLPSMPKVNSLAMAAGKSPGASGLTGVDLGARAVTAGVNNVFGPGDDQIEALQGGLQTDSVARFLPNWLDQAARGAESLVARGADLVTEGTVSGSRQQAIQARDEKMLGFDDAAMEANGKVDPALMAKFRAKQAAAAALPVMEDPTPARVAEDPAAKTYRNDQRASEEFTRGLAQQGLGTMRMQLMDGTAGQGAANFLMNKAAKFNRQFAGQEVAQQNADTNAQHQEILQRGQDMGLMPKLGEMQQESAVAQAIAKGNLEEAHRIATIGKPLPVDPTEIVPADIVNDTPPTLVNKRNGAVTPLDIPDRKQRERERQAKAIAASSTATIGVRG